jgi:hypothetical protein
MKTKILLALLALPVATLFAGNESNSNHSAGPATAESESRHESAGQEQSHSDYSPGKVLANQVRDIAKDSDLSTRAKNRQIANAVRLTLVAVTANIHNPSQALQLVLDLATQSAKAAPEFANAVLGAVTDSVGQIPLLSGLSGLAGKVQAAVSAGVKAAGEESGQVHFDSDHERKQDKHDGDHNGDHEYGGRDDDHIVSHSH